MHDNRGNDKAEMSSRFTTLTPPFSTGRERPGRSHVPPEVHLPGPCGQLPGSATHQPNEKDLDLPQTPGRKRHTQDARKTASPESLAGPVSEKS